MKHIPIHNLLNALREGLAFIFEESDECEYYDPDASEGGYTCGQKE